MSRTAFLVKLTLLTFSGCVFSPFASNRTVRTEQLVRLARAELAGRGLTLPSDHTGTVSDSTMIIEIPPYDIPLYVVSFYSPKRPQPIPLYSVDIDRQTGQIRGVIDTSVLRRAN